MLCLPTQFRCCDCKRNFKTDQGLSAHLLHSASHQCKQAIQKKNNEKPLQHCRPMECNMCKRTFETMAALEQHKKSIRHQPLCHIKCLGSGKCKKKFDCPSAQLQHLESGRCRSKITKTELNVAILKNDVNGVITTQASPKWLLEEDMSETGTSPALSPLLTPTSTEFLDSYPSTVIHSPTGGSHPNSLVGTDLSQMFDPRLGAAAGHTRCPICPPSRTRTFGPGALQQHLSSSVHAKGQFTLVQKAPDEILFHCPLALMKGTSPKKPLKHFSTVSGLAQHIESGACQGGKETLRRAVEYLRNEMKNMDLGGVKLLN